MPPLRIAIAGLGTVGAVVARRLRAPSALGANAPLIGSSARDIELVAVSARRRRDLGVAFVDDPLDLAARDDLDLIVELIGGADGVARELVSRALECGKHVVTANKALLAKHGIELARRAETKRVSLNYEAAIASGIPIVKTLRESLAGAEITRINSILNGTCNYILCQMAERDIGFAEALSDAQARGYAEADPHLDISGEDAAHKLSLLMRLAFGCVPDHLPARGIEQIDIIDMKLARHMGYAIRLIAHAEKKGDAVGGAVSPMLVPLSSKLAQSQGTDNVIALESASSHLLLEGEGAGAEPTANGVIADIIDIARDIRLPVFGTPVEKLRRAETAHQDRPSAFYLRAFVMDRAGSMAAIANMMAAYDISLAKIHQPAAAASREAAPIALITHPITEDNINAALRKFSASDVITAPPIAIKIASKA